MTVKHSLMTDAVNGIHEPKGVSTAAAGTVYESTGLGSGEWRSLTGTNVVRVEVLGDLPDPAAGIITLAASTKYIFTAAVNVGTNVFTLSEATIVSGIGSSIASVTYTGSGTLFTGVNVNCCIENISIIASAGKVFSITAGPTKIFQFFNATIVTCDTVGDVANILAFQINNVAAIVVTTTGITFAGLIEATFAFALIMNMTAGSAFDLGTSTTGSFSLESSLFDLIGAGAVAVDGLVASGNITTGGLGTLLNNRFRGAGTPLNNISQDDALWNFSSNDDIPTTRPDSLLSFPSGPTTTTISAINTPTLIAGTWTVERASQMTGTAAGRSTYNGGQGVVVPVTASVSLEPASGTNKNFTVYIAKNGTEVANSAVHATISSGAPGNITVIWQEALAITDFLEVFIENNSDAIDGVVNSATFRVN